MIIAARCSCFAPRRVRPSSESRRSLLFPFRSSRCERTTRETTYEDCDVRQLTISLIDFEADLGKKERPDETLSRHSEPESVEVQ